MPVVRRWLIPSGFAASLLIAGGFALSGKTGWQETAWPFGRDAFPPGKAFRSADLRLYVRPKLGFCGNCETGVVEDSEVDRVTDVDLLDVNFTPVDDGKPVRIGGLNGRARLYRVKAPNGRPALAEALAVSTNCDLVVALIVGDQIADAVVRRSAHDFIESDAVQTWLNGVLQGR
jgi:hypothetical protein